MSDRVAAAADDTVDLIPRAVRDKLDRVGIKLHLKEWQTLAVADRQRLCALRCETTAEVGHYAAEIDRLVRAATGRLADRLRR